MQYEAGDFVYSCGIVERYCPEYKKPVLVIRLHKHEKTYDFTISMLETLERLSYITVSETGLTAQAFQNYAEIFFMWEAQFCEKGEIYGSLQ